MARASVNVNIRMDAEVKRQFKAFCADAGMTMTTAFNEFARAVVRERGFPFRIGGEPNAETLEAIREVKRMKTDPALGRTYADADEMMKDLLSDVSHQADIAV